MLTISLIQDMSLTTPFFRLFSIGVLLSLAGCQSIQDQRIPLAPAFTENADLVQIKKPIMQFKDRHFEQTTSMYQVRNMAIGEGRSDVTEHFNLNRGLSGVNLQTSDRFTRFIWNELLGIQARANRQYKLMSQRDFHFEVEPTQNTGSNPIVYVDCQLLHLDQVLESEREVLDKKGREKKLSETQRSRVQSFLRCELTQSDQFWQLSLDIDENQLPKIQLARPISESADDFFAVEHEQKTQYLVGGQWRDSSIPFPLVSGLHLYQRDTQVAALSFEGQTPKIWLSKKNGADSKTLLFAASYAILMYDWLDKDWRQ